jgi:hypothetical protein
VIILAIICFAAGLALGSGAAVAIYAHLVERRAEELARQWSETEQHWNRIRQFAHQGGGQ